MQGVHSNKQKLNWRKNEKETKEAIGHALQIKT